MTGALSAQQGLLGVAAALARPVEKPDARPPLRVSDSPQARLGETFSPRRPQPRPRKENSEEEQAVDTRVDPATLLEASLIASALLPCDEQPPPPALPRPSPWQPPPSSLPLRDRKA